MRTILRAGFILSVGGCVLLMTGCAGMSSAPEPGFSYQNFPVASGSAAPGEGHHVTFKGSPKSLSGSGFKIGDSLRDVKVTKTDLSLVSLTDSHGKVRIVSVVPSLDTKVCEQQTHYLSEKNNGLDQRIELITISVSGPPHNRSSTAASWNRRPGLPGCRSTFSRRNASAPA